MSSLIKLSVPGSIMLMGEHAVLFGETALSCAIDRHLHITLQANDNQQIEINSQLASYQANLQQLPDEPKLSFVIEAIRHFQKQLPGGFKLTIESEFSHQLGLGSSAAVTAGVVAALLSYSQQATDLESIFDHSLKIIHRQQQGRGSGADLIASLYGSTVAYRVKPRSIEQLPVLPNIGLFYAGYKTKTPQVLKKVEQAAKQQPQIYRQLYQLMGQVSEQSKTAIKRQDWPQLGQLMNIYHGLMDALGVSDHALSDMVYQLRQQPTVWGAKISGSGLGDCVLSLSNSQPKLHYQTIELSASTTGLRYATDQTTSH